MKRRWVLCGIAAALWAGSPPAAADEPLLIAELRHTGGSSGACCFPTGATAETMAFMLLYDFQDFIGGPKHFGMNAAVELGGEVTWTSAQAGFADFTVSSQDFTALVARLTNNVNEVIERGAIGLNGIGQLSGGESAGIFEADGLEGIHTCSDLTGYPIGFIRLLVHNVQIAVHELGDELFSQDMDWDVTWQFWAGQPLQTGGGQRSDVDEFLAYVNPLQKKTTLPTGTTSFPVRIVYGATIDPLTFEASLNGTPVGGFHPVAGTNETVTIPLSSGHNTLKLQVDGQRSDGHTAMDKDQLTFIVP